MRLSLRCGVTRLAKPTSPGCFATWNIIRWITARQLDGGSPMSGTADVADAHIAVLAERLGTFIVTSDPADMIALSERFEMY
jgi:hypothetical protein